MINKYNKTFSKKYILCDLRYISFPQLLLSTSMKYFQLEALKAMEILSGEQMRGPRKMQIVVVSHFNVWGKDIV